MDNKSIFDAIVKLHKGKDDPTLSWPVTRPSVFEGNAADVIAPYLSGPGINIEDIGPMSENFEDRRGETYTPPGLLETIAGKLRDFAYNNQRLYASPYTSDIDASVERMKQLHGITPVLQELVRREQGFRMIDEEHPREQRDEIKREHARLKKRKDDDK